MIENSRIIFLHTYLSGILMEFDGNSVQQKRIAVQLLVAFRLQHFHQKTVVCLLEVISVLL